MTEETFKSIVKKFGKKNNRSWSGKEYDILEYVFHSDSFLAIFVENKEDKVFYEEIREFETDDLVVDGHDLK